ncbi:MAG TPA: hypothetical protein PLX58_09595, partial [Smithellaceae bacterium]|nr:hypothetical protein [Smithellaceae bacterium]
LIFCCQRTPPAGNCDTASWRGQGEDGKRGYRRQKIEDNFKPLLPMCKTSTPGLLKQATPAGGGQ